MLSDFQRRNPVHKQAHEPRELTMSNTQPHLHHSKVDRFLNKRYVDNDFNQTEDYQSELKRVYKPNPLSHIEWELASFFFITPLLAWFFEGIFCYLTVLAMTGMAWGEYKQVRRETRNLEQEEFSLFKKKPRFRGV